MNGFAICASRGGSPSPDTAWNGRDEKNYREFRLAAKSYCDALRKMGVSSAPECDWDESPQKRLRETLAFADNLSDKEYAASAFKCRRININKYK